MLKFLIIILAFVGPPPHLAKAEITDQSTAESITSQAQLCLSVEKKFRDHLVAQIDNGIRGWSERTQCFLSTHQTGSCAGPRQDLDRIRSTILENRERVLGQYRAIFNYWMQRLPEHEKNLAQTCFLPSIPVASPNGSIERGVQFDRNPRVLKIQNGREGLCLGIHHRWIADLSGLEAQFRSSPSTFGISQDIADQIESFRNSPVEQWASSRTLYDSDLTGSAFNHALLNDMNQAISSLENLRTELGSISDASLYLLYNFANQFSQFSTSAQSSLSTEEKAIASTCQNSSGWAQDCTAMAYRGFGRCGSRLGRLGREFLPFIALVDSMAGYQRTSASQVAGILTNEEAAAQNRQHSMEFLFGLPVMGVYSGLIRQGALRGSYRVGFVEELQNIRNGLRVNIPIRSCIPSDCSVGSVISTSDSLRHISRHLRPSEASNLPAFLEARVAALMRGETGDLIRQRQNLIDQLPRLDPDAARRMRARINQMTNSIRMRMRTELGFDLRKEQRTSLFPQETTPEEVIARLRTATLVRTRRQDNSSAYEVTLDGSVFEIKVCRRPPCQLDGRTVNGENEILSIYPICGPNVVAINSVREIEMAIANTDQPPRIDNLMTTRPCP